jgi:hypothetical protein
VTPLPDSETSSHPGIGAFYDRLITDVGERLIGLATERRGAVNPLNVQLNPRSGRASVLKCLND